MFRLVAPDLRRVVRLGWSPAVWRCVELASSAPPGVDERLFGVVVGLLWETYLPAAAITIGAACFIGLRIDDEAATPVKATARRGKPLRVVKTDDPTSPIGDHE